MSNEYNPYAAPSQVDHQVALRTADLGKRFLGALIDGFIGLFFVGPGYVLMIVGGGMESEASEPGPLFFVGLLAVGVGFLAIIGTQVFLLATRSQTIGKLLMKTQIVEFETGRPAGLVKTLLLRALLNGVIGAIPCIGAIYSIVDICFIFREDRRCIHDLIASTVVIDIS